uniref:Acyltransferase n=1 Tax=Clastoptera arizonana TaxID=38151 RepID=A0A1B6EFZ4_9HEMI
MKIFGIQFAPLDIPLERRLQTLAAACWFGTLAFLPFIGLFTLIYFILFTRYWMFGLLYATWICYDRKISENGGRRFQWIRNWRWWHYFRYYFPLTLLKTADLPPGRNYLLCTFPHGILCSGAFGVFATNHSDFAELYPGIVPYLVTISLHFFMPLSRELILGVGGVSASRESIMHLCNDQKESKAVVLMVGGASEALKCHPGPYTIILNLMKSKF